MCIHHVKIVSGGVDLGGCLAHSLFSGWLARLKGDERASWYEFVAIVPDQYLSAISHNLPIGNSVPDVKDDFLRHFEGEDVVAGRPAHFVAFRPTAKRGGGIDR